jgi:hypothetical protein
VALEVFGAVNCIGGRGVPIKLSWPPMAKRRFKVSSAMAPSMRASVAASDLIGASARAVRLESSTGNSTLILGWAAHCSAMCLIMTASMSSARLEVESDSSLPVSWLAGSNVHCE